MRRGGWRVVIGALCVPALSVVAMAQAPDSTKHGAGDSVTVAGAPAPAPTPTLPRIMVSGRSVDVPPRYEAAYRRAASGRGVYFTREEIEASNPRDLQSLMQRVPSVMMNARSITFQKCQGGLPSPSGGVALAQEAKVQVYVDGRKTSASDGESALEVLQDILPSMVQIMEVYNGSSRIPGEYSTDACAVILIWTKSY
jgi:hypothetical protein